MAGPPSTVIGRGSIAVAIVPVMAANDNDDDDDDMTVNGSDFSASEYTSREIIA